MLWNLEGVMSWVKGITMSELHAYLEVLSMLPVLGKRAHDALPALQRALRGGMLGVYGRLLGVNYLLTQKCMAYVAC